MDFAFSYGVGSMEMAFSRYLGDSREWFTFEYECSTVS